MSLFTKLLKKSLSDFFRKRKRWLIAFMIFISLIISINLVVNHYVEKVVGGLIREFVHEKSEGFYAIDFDEIAYVLNEGRLLVNNFKFEIHPDYGENLDFKKLTQPYVYLASIPQLHIDIIEFWSIFFYRKLRVIGIEVGSPDIKIINLNKSQQPKRISFEAGNLYEVISEHLAELKINDFKISDGNIVYETYLGPDFDNFNVKGITFEVKNFQVNEQSYSRSDKFFYTDDISLEIKNQVLLLKDSIHKVTFDKFYISTLSNELEFENFNLTRRDTTRANKKTHDHYEVDVPILRLSGIDFMSAYNNNLLTIDSLKLDDPVINIKKRSKDELNKKNHFKLMDILMSYQDYILINHFKLSDAKLIYTDELQSQAKKYSIDHISAYLKNVRIDSVRNPRYRYGFDFEKADFMVKDYEVTMPDSLNTIKFDEFTIASNPFEIAVKNLIIQPGLSVASSAKTNRIYANFPYILLSEFDLAKAINQDTFLIDELYLQEPHIKISAPLTTKNENQKLTMGGLFGIYKNLQANFRLFKLEKLNIIDGKFAYENQTETKKNLIELKDINLGMENIKVDSSSSIENDLLGSTNINLSLGKSSIGLSTSSVGFENFQYNSFDERLKINQMNIAVDTTVTNQKLKVSLPDLIVMGINPNQVLFEDNITLDSLIFQELEILSNVAKNKTSKPLPYQFPTITINHLIGKNGNIVLRKDDLPTLTAQGVSIEISNFMLDKSLETHFLNQIDYDKINYISIDYYDSHLAKQQHRIDALNILWEDKISTLSMENIKYKPFGSPKNKYNISVPKISVTGINLKRAMKDLYFEGDKILIENATANIKLAARKQKKQTSLDLQFIPHILGNSYYGIKANTFDIKDATINITQKVEKDSLIIQAEKFNFVTTKFEIDTTSKITPNRFLFADEVTIQGDYLSSYHQSNSDFYNINYFYISTKEGDIRLNGIYYATNTKNEFSKKDNIKFTSENITIKDMDFYGFTQNQRLDLSEIIVSKARFNYTPENEIDRIEASIPKSKAFPSDTVLLQGITKLLSDPSKFKLKGKYETKKEKVLSNDDEFPFDTLLLKSINIDRVLVTDSKVILENSNAQKPALVIPDIWFLAEDIKYDPISAVNSNRIFYSDHLKAKISNINYVLPDNFSAIKIDELVFDSQDSSIHATNFTLSPLLSKYDYGIAKGFQSSWLEIKNESISFEKVDFLTFINKGSFHAQTLKVDNMKLRVFRDKRVPFPEWQRRPLPQTSLREMNFTFNVGKILLEDGFISYQEHAEKAYTTGEVFFSDLNATILNLTNDSLHTSLHPYAKIGVTAKVFGKGDVKAEFLFDLMNTKNIHTYGVEINPFDLTEFNRILIPSASVKITSGINKKIIMSAKADEEYSYGEMKFYYEDLKITLLNRESETSKGLGNVLGSFFANTFIIKSNNPRNLILRNGDIFFERDEKRAIFNYWTKTFLSGVVSSIGATNNKKKIKKMQEENLKEIQTKKSTL